MSRIAFLSIFPVIISIFYCTWYIKKHTGKIAHIIYMYIHSHLIICIGSLLPARRPKFAKIAQTTWKVEQACLRCCMWSCFLPLPTYTRAQNPLLRWRGTDGKDSVTPIDRAIIQIRVCRDKSKSKAALIFTPPKSDIGRSDGGNL